MVSNLWLFMELRILLLFYDEISKLLKFLRAMRWKRIVMYLSVRTIPCCFHRSWFVFDWFWKVLF